jgi:hypothetical protein
MPLTVKPSRRRATCPTSVGNCGKSRIENGKFLLLESVIFKKKKSSFGVEEPHYIFPFRRILL